MVSCTLQDGDAGQYPGSEGLPGSRAHHGLLQHANEHGLLAG